MTQKQKKGDAREEIVDIIKKERYEILFLFYFYQSNISITLLQLKSTLNNCIFQDLSFNPLFVNVAHLLLQQTFVCSFTWKNTF